MYAIAITSRSAHRSARHRSDSRSAVRCCRIVGILKRRMDDACAERRERSAPNGFGVVTMDEGVRFWQGGQARTSSRGLQMLDRLDRRRRRRRCRTFGPVRRRRDSTDGNSTSAAETRRRRPHQRQQSAWMNNGRPTSRQRGTAASDHQKSIRSRTTPCAASARPTMR